MDIRSVLLISSVIFPVIITIGIVIWTYLLRDKNQKNRQQLLAKTDENKLWQTLVSHKERHISVLKKKLKNNQL